MPTPPSPTGISLSVVLGVGLLFIVVSRRIASGPRRHALTLATLAGYGTTLWYAVQRYLLQLWAHYYPWLLGYVALMAALGAFGTMYMLRGQPPEPWQSAILARALRLLACLLLLRSSHSARASLAITLSFLAAYAIAYKMGVYDDEGGRGLGGTPWGTPVRLRPPTANGRYLSEGQFAAQRDEMTDASLRELFSSPAYQRWLLQNHHRLAVEPEEGSNE